MYFAGTLVRLLLILAFPASLMAAYGILRLVQPFTSVKLSEPRFRGKRRRGEVFAVNKWISILFVGLLFSSFLPYIVIGTIPTASTPGPLASSAVPVLFDGKYATDWPDALNWLKANTTEDSIICSWWDYGYWIQTMANRTTLADGSTSNSTQIIMLANAMMRPHNESLPILKSFNADYIVVFVTFNPNSPIEGRIATYYEEASWPLGDNAKWGRMAEIAGYNMTKFYKQNPTTGEVTYTDLYTNSTIARLMYTVADPLHFELVYRSNLGYVKIYKIIY
jgi:dolichyl-diphosphooligosaccharide--protein glycosyltransferase